MKIPEHLSQQLFSLLPDDPAILVLDFDGVISDDRVYVTEEGKESVCCTRGDGMGTTLLRRAGFPVLVISTEKNPVVAARCAKLKVECIQGVPDKTLAFRKLLSERGIEPARVVFVGNDVNDIGCAKIAGASFSVADGHPMLKRITKGVLTKPGGRGAVREIAELILTRLGRDLLYNESDRADAPG